VRDLSSSGTRPSAVPAALLLCALLALLIPVCALGAGAPKSSHAVVAANGRLTQLAGKHGCLVDRSAKGGSCGTARALEGPGPFMGSRAIAVSADGQNVYVASSKSDAIAIFTRNQKTGTLTQPTGKGGCVSVKGKGGCARALGLDGPNSVALSPEGRFLYATSRASNSVTAFHRNTSTGALTQLAPGTGCVAGVPIPGCTEGRALVGPDVVAVSADGQNVYVGSFFGNAVATFQRAKNGVLTQAADTTGCIAEATAGCAAGIALGAPEGLAVSPDGSSVYVAAALSNAVVELVREPKTGALSQPSDGCIVEVALTGCTTGVQLSGANAVAIAPAGRDVYVTSLLSNSVTSFSRSAAGVLTQKPGTHACMVYLRAVGCSFGRAMIAPEGLAVSPDGSSVYLASLKTGAIDVLDRERESGFLAQKAGTAGCLAPAKVQGCDPGRALRGVSSIAVSPDGRYVYSTSFASNAVDVFRRNSR
jgi:DNA-binding beta-propeller fold protein YncE